MKLSREIFKKEFLNGSKPRRQWRVGVEWEKIGVYQKTGKAIAYHGSAGVAAIFQKLIRNYGWAAQPPKKPVIALEKNGTFITLEPGGQIELSGKPARFLADNAAELSNHLKEIRAVSEPLGIVWLGLGAQPLSVADQIPWVPKKRYRIMQTSLKNRGALTYSMMKETASVQISLDYSDENDAIRKLRLAMTLSPLFTAIFANSPFQNAKKSSYLSRRAYIWSKTAPERSGIIPGIFDPHFSFDRYIDYALRVPLLFIVRRERWIRVSGLDFARYLQKGYRGFEPTLEDWKLHLTSIFTESRLKDYVEIRSIDCQKTGMGLAAVAFIKGLFYDDKARESAQELLRDTQGISAIQMRDLALKASKMALRTPFKGKNLQYFGECLYRLAGEGLGRLAKEGLATQNEADYLKPLGEMLVKKRVSPAELLVAQTQVFKNSRQRLAQIIRLSAI